MTQQELREAFFAMARDHLRLRLKEDYDFTTIGENAEKTLEIELYLTIPGPNGYGFTEEVLDTIYIQTGEFA